jgi:deferrochelatase/peroxidase EfeB
MMVVEPFFGEHQGGIVTPQQSHIYVAVLDLTTDKRDDVIALLKSWTDAAARMSKGETARPILTDDEPEAKAAADSGDILGLGAAGLTITFGFGPGMFTKDGKDRYGISNRRPAALVDLPRFNGDQLLPQKTGGDIMIQACANDSQVAFHAVRQLARMAYGNAAMRWGQAGFASGHRAT